MRGAETGVMQLQAQGCLEHWQLGEARPLPWSLQRECGPVTETFILDFCLHTWRPTGTLVEIRVLRLTRPSWEHSLKVCCDQGQTGGCRHRERTHAATQVTRDLRWGLYT